MKNAWITFDGKNIKFVGEIVLDHRAAHSKFDEYDAAYLAGSAAKETALSHIGDIKHHVTRDLIKLTKQKNDWNKKA